MEYNSQKADREQLLAKAKRSIAAPFFNFVTENWCKVAATRPNLDGKEVQELLWQQWVGTMGLGRGGKENLAAGETGAGAAIVSVKREKKGAKRKKAVVNLERVKLEGRQVEANRGENETKEKESLAVFKEGISSEPECVAPSRDPHQEDAGDLGSNHKKTAVWGNRPLKADIEKNARKIKLATEEDEKWMDEKKQEEEKQRKEILEKEEKRKKEVARLKEDKAKADQKEKRKQKMREEENSSLEINQHSNFIPTTPPHTPNNSNFTSTTKASSCSGVKEVSEVGSQAELKRKDKQDKISQEHLQEDSSFDSEVK